MPLTRGQPEIVRELRAAPDWPTRPMTIVRITHLIASEREDVALAEAREAYDKLLGTPYVPDTFEEFLGREAIGSPDRCLARIRELEEAGVDYLLVDFASADQQERAARLVLPYAD